MTAKLIIPAGMAAAMASGEYQERNIRSTKCCTDQAPVLKIRGVAITRSCRYPPSALQRFVTACMMSFPVFR
jgi:hypothetical protein